MPAAVFIALLLATALYLGVKSERARARRLKAPQRGPALLEQHPELLADHATDTEED
jgi:hypothetical protein